MADGFSSPRRGQVEPSAPVVTSHAVMIAAGVVAALYFGREVFIPIAIAILLSFVLAIPVGLLQGWGLGKRLSVVAVVVLAFSTLLSIGAVLTSQLAQLAGDLPRYQWTIRDKIASLKEAATGHGPLERVAAMLQNLSNEISGPARPAAATAAGNAVPAPTPIPVEVVTRDNTALETLGAFVTPLLHPLATIGLVAIFVVFILLQRTDLRNRLIRLAGSHDLQRTTAAMNEAATRLSRFFLMQVLLNSLFGLLVGIGLWLIGVPSPVLWGIMGAISRFIPYVGVIIAAGFPLVLSAAVDPGWGMLLQTAAFFMVIEFMFGQAVEPLVYGRSTGLSPIAVIASVTFWTWLWGGVGLLIATPLTVCLVVLGRYVDQLAFLDVMFGDRPPLTAAESFYQRMLAGDVSEGIEQAEVFLKEHTLSTFYEEVALKGLALAQADTARGALDAARLAVVEATIAEVIEELSDHEDAAPTADLKVPEAQRADGDADLDESLDRADEAAHALPALDPDDLREEWRGPTPVLCLGSRNQLDGVGARMLAQVLGKRGLGAKVEGAEFLTGDRRPGADLDGVRMVCLCFLDSGNPAQVRYAVRRLRRRVPTATILVASWGIEPADARGLCEASRSDFCASGLTQAVGLCMEAARRPDAPAEIEPDAVAPLRASAA